MIRFIAICFVLFVLALGLILLTSGHDIAALFEAYQGEPVLQKLAWIVVIFVPLVLIPCALWLADALARQRDAAGALELRLDGVRTGIRDATKAQFDVEASLRHLARSDPEEAIGAVQQRLTEAERAAQVQEGRNEIGDLQSRVDSLRAQQEALQQRLAPVLEKRRGIEQLFADLDNRQADIDRALTEVASGDDAVALDLRLKDMAEFVRRAHERCDGIEAAAKTLAGLKEDYAALASRLDPFAAPDDGVVRRVREIGEMRDRLAADIDALRHTPDGDLAVRVQRFAEEKRRLDDGLGQIDAQFGKLATLRKDVETLFAHFDRALDTLGLAPKKGAGAGAGARIADVAQFIKTTQAKLDDLDGKMATFGQLQSRLADLQSRLAPLEAEQGGVASVIAQLAESRDRLAAKLERINGGDGAADLASRVQTFSEARKDLEERVAAATEQFAALAAIRRDIAGLFDRLSSAANGSLG